jgi:hypothetical protein
VEFFDFVDQKRRAILRFLTEHPELFGRQGTVHPSWRAYRGRRLGPFFRLAFRQAGKQQSIYLGCDPAFAAEVRATLEQLQAPVQTERELRKLCATARQALAEQKRRLDHELTPLGLYRQGSEVRGWRGAASSLGADTEYPETEEDSVGDRRRRMPDAPQ